MRRPEWLEDFMREWVPRDGDGCAMAFTVLLVFATIAGTIWRVLDAFAQ